MCKGTYKNALKITLIYEHDFEIKLDYGASISMFGGAYGDARMPNWPHWHRTPLPRIATTGLRRDKGG